MVIAVQLASMRKLILLSIILLSVCANAQKGDRYWSIGVNPFSLGESMSSIGPCAGFRFSPGFELWLEGSYIFHNLYKIQDWKNMSGYRFIFQPRYYVGKGHTLFITPEFRLKQFSYTSALSFVNKTMNDTLYNYTHRASQVLAGGAFVIGGQFVLSERKKIFLEVTAGIGGKLRHINRKNIPGGYEYEVQPGGFGLAPHYNWDNDGTPYFPFGLRLMWQLNDPKKLR